MSEAGMKKSPGNIPEPRFENGRAMLMAGTRVQYTSQDMDNIPAQWERFAKHIGKLSNEVGRAAYGLCFNFVKTPFSFDYMCAVEISAAGHLPGDFVTAETPARRYAIFRHDEHVSKIRDTIDFIWNKWLPNSGHTALVGQPEKPYMIERYGEGFDPQKGMGDIQLWIPLATQTDR
jgi:AraC family transcriptional regulator